MQRQLQSRCQGESTCLVDLAPVLDSLACACRDKLKEAKTSENLTIIWKCTSGNLFYPFSKSFSSDGKAVTVDKKTALGILALFDLVCVAFMLWAAYKMHQMNKEKFEAMQDSVI